MTPEQIHLRYLALQELADSLGDRAAELLDIAPEVSQAYVEVACAIRVLSGDSWVRAA